MPRFLRGVNLRGLACGFVLRGLVCAQHFGDTPGLRNAPAWCIRRFGIEYFADGPDPVIGQVRIERIQEPSTFRSVHAGFQRGVDEMADQPDPHGALMVSGIARAKISEVHRLIVAVARRKTAQSERRQ